MTSIWENHETRWTTFLLIKEESQESIKKILDEIENFNKKETLKNILKNLNEFYVEVKGNYSGCGTWIGGVNRTCKRVTCKIYYRKELMYCFDVVYLYQATNFFCNVYVDQIAKGLKEQGYCDFDFFKKDLLGFKAKKII